MGSIEPAFLSGAPVYIGVDLGGSNISGMAFAWQGERYHCVATEKIDTEAKEGYDHVIVRIRSVIAELVQFSAEFLGNGPAVCHDYDNNGTTDLGDLIIFSPAFVAGAHCP